MKFLAPLLYRACFWLDLALKRPRLWLLKALFERHGVDFHFDPSGIYTFENISVGDHVHLGAGAVIVCAKSKVSIGNCVMFGPNVSIFGGGHNTEVIGKFMIDVTEKRPADDRGVIIEDDVWIGTRAVLLRGIRVGRGSIIGAGSVVTRDVPPYAIAAGSPARVVRFRFDVETIARHEQLLYPPEQRLSRDALSAFFSGHKSVARPCGQ